jgi:prevent-host-death family protein
METMAISKFKAHVFQVLGQVAKTREPVVVTKYGKPFAEVVPFCGFDKRPVPGKLSKTLVFGKDIVSSIGGSCWKACK